MREDWLIDPSNFLGDVILNEVCPPGIDVARYLNYHEDPGGLSLALGREAIFSIQQIMIPLTNVRRRDWIPYAVTEIRNAVEVSPSSSGSHLLMTFRPSSPKAMKAREITARLARRLPINLRSQFQATTAFSDTMDHEMWARYVIGVVDVIENPERVLAELDAQEIRRL